MKFEWNLKKDLDNKIKHGVSFEQASYVFTDPYALTQFDLDHSEDEGRWILLDVLYRRVNKSLNQALLVVIHKYINDANVEIVRIIIARKATKEEQKTYKKRCLI